MRKTSRAFGVQWQWCCDEIEKLAYDEVEKPVWKEIAMRLESKKEVIKSTARLELPANPNNARAVGTVTETMRAFAVILILMMKAIPTVVMGAVTVGCYA